MIVCAGEKINKHSNANNLNYIWKILFNICIEKKAKLKKWKNENEKNFQKHLFEQKYSKKINIVKNKIIND